MSDTSEGLRPCPFCGGSAILEGQDLAWTVTCEMCGMQTAVRNKPEQASADWNTRVPLGADDATVERVARAMANALPADNSWVYIGNLDDLTCVSLDGEFDLVEPARAAIAAMGGK